MLRRIACFSSLFLLFSSSLFAKTYTIGGARPATLLTPTQVKSTEKIPLVVFLHGYTSSGTQSDSFFGISRQRDALNIAVALPDGTRNSNGYRFWNATPECCDFEQSGVDDAGYIAGLIREASSVAPIDPARVYLIGHSNGGFMSYRMACDYPGLIRGFISIAGAFYANPNLCKNPGDLNVLQIHGSADDTVPIANGETGPRYFANRGGCDAAVESKGAFDLVSASGAETDSYVWNNCSNDTRVGYWRINGGAHAPYLNSSWLRAALDFVK
jgi:polyhydroxybutyrate depolymerase